MIDPLEQAVDRAAIVSHAARIYEPQITALRAENERLKSLLQTIREFPNFSYYYGTQVTAEIDAALEKP